MPASHVSVRIKAIVYVEHQAQCQPVAWACDMAHVFLDTIPPKPIPRVPLGPRIILIDERTDIQRGQVSHKASQSTAQVQAQVLFLSRELRSP